MSVINKVYVQGVTHPFKDEVSGYGVFGATATLASSATTTQVATINYRTFNTTTAAFGATTTIDLYSTSGSASGNNWVASINSEDNTNLIFSTSTTSTILGTMPDFGSTTYNTIPKVLDELVTAGIMSKTTSGSSLNQKSTYTLLCNSLSLTYQKDSSTVIIGGETGSSGAPGIFTLSKGESVSYNTRVISIDDDFATQSFNQNILNGTNVTEDSNIILTPTVEISVLGELPSITIDDSESTILNALASAGIGTITGNDTFTSFVPGCTIVIAYRDGDAAIVTDSSTTTYDSSSIIFVNLADWKSNIPSGTYISNFALSPSAGTTMYSTGKIVLRYTYKANSSGGSDLTS